MMKIVIIKLGALGDVVRTLPVLPAIKEKYPNSEVCWITKKQCLDIFEANPYIKEVFALPFHTGEKFDILYNFDIEKEATELAKEIKADKKYGFYSDGEYPAAFNTGAEYYLNTLFDDELKKENRKTYQEMMFEAAELPWKKQFCPIYLSDKDKAYAEDFIKKNNLKTEKLIGVHMGASPRWPSKAWHEDELKKFVTKAKEKNYEILLFGGTDEVLKQPELIKEFERKGIKIYSNNPKNTIKEFASLVELCKAVVCSDSLALHVSMALKKPAIGLFFCTSPHEIEGYGILKKIVSPMLEQFFPERMDEYSEELAKSISAEDVLNAVEEFKI
ncbi:glycosyltransferase family 9 protein [Candidatus Pacearchaeota archaeon]|nr:glycosyltransferase family 9 protein [Candidatus Pacearchaeota archaeon]